MDGDLKNILFYLGHPAHYHNISVIAKQLKQLDHKVILVVREKDVLADLVRDLPYEIIYLGQKKGIGTLSLIKTVVKREFQLYRIAKKVNPNIMVGTDIVITHVGRLLGIPSVILNEDDAREVPFLAKYGFKYATAVFSPSCCDISPYDDKKIAYNGYHELAYLHPKYFTPNKNSIESLYKYNEDYFIIRLAELTAHHDKGKKGVTINIAKKLIELLSPFGRVYISSERILEYELEQFRILIDPRQMHNALYYAKMYIGDSQTMAAEAAVLGTPSVRYNDFVGKLGYLEELEHKYGLTYGIPTGEEGKLLEKVSDLLNMGDLKSTFVKRKEIMLAETDDVSELWMNYIIENSTK